MRLNGFDRIARPYRWLEYLALGPLLERCRTHFLPALGLCRHALVLGDGDGRFLARLLDTNAALEAEAVDASAAMLTLLRQNCAAHSARLRTVQADALSFTPTGPYDLVVTHFFLDCLTQPELDALVKRIAPRMTPQALWLVSDFRIPTGALRLPAQLYIRSLYLGFRLLTGLRTTHLPDHATPLARAGFQRVRLHRSLMGLLQTELWVLSPSAIVQPAFADAHPISSPMRLDATDSVPPPDPIPDPEPISPSLDEPDPGVFRHTPGPHPPYQPEPPAQ